MQKPKILVARATFDSVIERLSQHLDVQSNQDDVIFSRAQLIENLQGKQGVCTGGSERIDTELLAACPGLKIAANVAVGYNNFDVDACTAAGVVCTNTPDVLTDTTADMAFALLMATARRMSESEAFLRRGDWKKFKFDLLCGSEVHGSTLGILGMGRIGQAIARRGALGFGMNVIYHNRSRLSEQDEAPLKARYVSKTELFQQADHVVLVLPYSPAVYHTVGAAELALMKPTATLVNIGRGGLVDENALADALERGALMGAGLDVFEGEPTVNPRLLAQTRVVLTPHVGSATVPTRLAMANLAADNLIAFFTGQRPPTPINAQVLHEPNPQVLPGA